MTSNNIKYSGFSLAKHKELTGDDFYDVRSIGNLTVAIVCDGLGTATKGAEAAKRVTTHLMNNLKIRPKAWSMKKSLMMFIESINSILYKESIANYQKSELVTTLAIVVLEGNRLYGANVGDSRIYLYRENFIHQLSNDHVIDEIGYESELTQAIGLTENIEPYYFENKIQDDDKILLCSDGLYNIMTEETLESGIKTGAHALVKKASNMMEDNLPDDTTAVVIDILHADELEILKQQKIIIPLSLSKNQIIDGYTLEKPLIENERTWLCSKKTKQYVLKFAPSQAIENDEILDLFVKEAWNAKRLKADFFPKAVIPKNRSQRYYVMQLFKGENLSTYMKHKNISIDDGIELASTLLKMSQYLLTNDLVHGDIKPENIMIAKDENANLSFKIIDFGSITEIFSTHTKARTPSFLSPERFHNDAISETTEIFAIGVTLYIVLTGKYPYGEIEPFQNPVFKQAKPASHYNKNIPTWLDSVILRAIAIDKDQRYSHYSQMSYELSHPQKVKPYFAKNAPLIEKSPLLFYKSAFTIMTFINFILIYFLLQ